MPSLKRNRLLSDLERERLVKRSSLDQHTRATNDVRVKKKLTAWFNSTSDVLGILENLPEDQIRDATSDLDVYILFNIIHSLLYQRKFYQVEGKADNPDDWKIVIDENTQQPAKDLDIFRASMLEYYIHNVGSYRSSNGPFSMLEMLEQMDKMPDYRDRVTDADRRGIMRLNQAREWFKSEVGKEPK